MRMLVVCSMPLAVPNRPEYGMDVEPLVRTRTIEEALQLAAEGRPRVAGFMNSFGVGRLLYRNRFMRGSSLTGIEQSV